MVLPAGSRSLTPIDTHTPASLAAAPMASVAGEGTSTAWSSRRPNHSPAVPHGVDRHTQSGWVGTNVSGNTTSPAPAAAASPISRQALSTVASRSRNTGVAWTAAAVTFSMSAPPRRRLGAVVAAALQWKHDRGLLVAQGHDGLHAGRLAGRPDAEEHPDGHADPEGQGDRPAGDGRRHGREPPDQ
jgi:hypothetical protein